MSQIQIAFGKYHYDFL